MIVESAEDRWWHEYNYREDVNLLSEALVQTTYQRFCGISRLLDQAASVNPGSSIAHVAQMFAANAREGGTAGQQGRSAAAARQRGQRG